MDKPWLSEKRIWRGCWWLPEKPDDTVAGVLTYDPSGGLTLDLVGGFAETVVEEVRPGTYDVRDEARTWSVLHGRAENRAITLLHCIPIGSQTYGLGFGLDRPDEQTISALTALVGVHLEEAQQAAFTECHMSIEDLTSWSEASVFRSTTGYENEKPNGKGTIYVEPVEEPSVVVDGTTITLAQELTLPFFERKRASTTGRMRHTAFVRFQPEQPWSLSAARDQAKSLQDLLSLATHRACGVLWMRLRMAPAERDHPEDYPICVPEVDVYLKHTVVGDPTAKALQHHDALFTCRDLPFEEVVPRWLDVRRDYEAASNMVLALRYATDGYIESQLLTAVGAAEVMHRALKIDQPPIPDEEFKALRAELLEHAPEVHRDWLKRTLRNDPTLRDRLLSLAARPDQEAMKRLVPDVEQWAKVATQARNDLAHEGRTRRQSIDEMIAAVKVTAAVVVMNLLQVLCVPGERQREIVNDHPELHQVALGAREQLTQQIGKGKEPY